VRSNARRGVDWASSFMGSGRNMIGAILPPASWGRPRRPGPCCAIMAIFILIRDWRGMNGVNMELVQAKAPSLISLMCVAPAT